MVKGVSSNERPVAQNNEPNKPNARNVPKKEAEQFSSLMDEERNALKGHPKSKKLNKVLDKVGDGLAKRLGPAEAADPQTPGAKQAGWSDKAADPQTPEAKQAGWSSKAADPQTLGAKQAGWSDKAADPQTPGAKQAGWSGKAADPQTPGAKQAGWSGKAADPQTLGAKQAGWSDKAADPQTPGAKQAGWSGKAADPQTPGAKQLGRSDKAADPQTPGAKQAGWSDKAADPQTPGAKQLGRSDKAADQQTPGAKQLGRSDKAADQQTPGAKQAERSDKTESFSDRQNPADKEGLPQSLDAFDIASMIARTHAPLQSASPTAEAAPAPPADLGKIVGEIANRILVSSPSDNPAGTQEIRIQLKESVLPNTEVRIYRHAGSLQVEFLTGSKDSQMFIEQRQPDIQKILGERLSNETVNVSVQDSQQTRGGQGDGRSRQQYINPNLDDDGN